MSDTTETKHAVAHDFAEAMSGKLPQDKLDAAVEALTGPAAAYGANGSVVCAIFYMRVQVAVTGGKTFTGNAGALGTAGGGANFGNVYTNDINRLYASTTAFQVNSTPVYFNVNFFDSNSNFLGSYQAGAVSVCFGTGGGSGSWS